MLWVLLHMYVSQLNQSHVIREKKIIGGSFSAPASHKLKFNPTGDDSNDGWEYTASINLTLSDLLASFSVSP